MSSFGAVRVVRALALDALGRLIVAGVANLPAAPFRGLIFGSASAHLVVMVQPGDELVLARTTSGTDLPIASTIDPAVPIAAQGFEPGDIGIRCTSGAIIRVSAAGDISLTPASGRAIYLNGGSANAVGSGAAVAISGSVTAPSGGGACTVNLSGLVSAPGNAGVKV